MKKFIIPILLLASCQSYAGQTGSGSIKFLQNAFGGWVFTVNHANNNPESCSRSNMILVGHNQQEEIYSFLLAAYTTGRPVVIFTNGCDSLLSHLFSVKGLKPFEDEVVLGQEEV